MADAVTDLNEAKGGRWLVAGLVVLAAILGLVLARLSPPAPVAESAPPSEFSGMRAQAVLARLVGGGEPHPVGSAANAATRERVLAELRRSGYAPEVAVGFGCRRGNSCAEVRNVIAHLPGTRPGKAVLLAAHYDSVNAGPGASDDLTGTAAILEIARALKAGPPPRRPVVFLLDEGEEGGLLGAEAFARTPAIREIGAAINLDARGTSGPALMFQTQSSNAGWIPLFARAVPRPVSSSLFVTVYQRLPNDTDFTVFDREGVPGYNFAFIGNAERYHTPLDNLANASPATLQHMGESAFALARALADGELPAAGRGGEVFFDVLSSFVVRWREAWSVPLALLALLLVGAASARIWRRRAASAGGTFAAFLGFLGGVAAAAASAWLFGLVLRPFGGLALAWPAEPRPVIVALWALGAAAALAPLSSLARSARPAGIWAGVWLGWALFGLALAWALPGASFLFVVPALAAGIAGLIGSGDRPAWSALLPMAVAAILWLPIALLLFRCLGTPGALIVATVVGLAATSLAPLLAAARRRSAVLWAALAIALVAAVLVPATMRPSAGAPRHVSAFYHWDADSSAGRWIVSGDLPPLPPQMAGFAHFEIGTPFPWSLKQAQGAVAPAPALPLPAPTLEVLADEKLPAGRRVRLRLASPRGAPTVTLQVPAWAGARGGSMAGVELPKDREGKLPQRGDWTTIQCLATPPGGVELDLELTATGPVAGYLVDRSPGLPPAGRALAAARPPDAMSDGDAIAVSRKVQF